MVYGLQLKICMEIIDSSMPYCVAAQKIPNHNKVRLMYTTGVRVKRIALIPSHKTELVGRIDNGRSIFMCLLKILCKEIISTLLLVKESSKMNAGNVLEQLHICLTCARLPSCYRFYSSADFYLL